MSADDPLEALRARIRARLLHRIEVRGIPIARLARRSGVNKATIHRVLDPDSTGDVQIGTLAKLARVLRCDVVHLLAPLPGEAILDGDAPLPGELAPADDGDG